MLLRSLIVFLFVTLVCDPGNAAPNDTIRVRPNILLLVAEDMGSRVGAFDDPVAVTPNLDRLARRGTRFVNTYTTAGVCAPSRAALILGMYQTSVGAHHMRTGSFQESSYRTVPPPHIKAFPELLRRAGYYTYVTNKLDYQFSGVGANTGPASIWHNEGDHAHWRGRAEDQPFFGMYQFYETHESRGFPDHPQKTDASGIASPVPPEQVKVPDYYPDTMVVRTAIAQQYNNIQIMDKRVGVILRELQEDGLDKNTIILWTTDHGDGLPRAKRELYDSGIHVPMIISWPDSMRPKYLMPGGMERQLVSFVDLGPTILSWAGVVIPRYMHGKPLADPASGMRRQYIFAAKDRLDEFPNRERAVRNERYKYILNFDAGTPKAQHLAYRDRLDIMQELWRLLDDGSLNAEQSAWFLPRPEEELYDTLNDRDEVHNLAESPAHVEILQEMRQVLAQWRESMDIFGEINEAEMAARFWPMGQQPMTTPPEIFTNSRSELLLQSPTEGASIIYRFNGSGWQLYTRPLKIDRNTLISAKAVRYGWAESPQTHYKYITKK